MSRTSTTRPKSPLAHRLRGYVGLSHSGPNGFAVGGTSDTPELFAHRQRDFDAVTNLKRARAIAREYHDWDVPAEAQLVQGAVEGNHQ